MGLGFRWKHRIMNSASMNMERSYNRFQTFPGQRMIGPQRKSSDRGRNCGRKERAS